MAVSRIKSRILPGIIEAIDGAPDSEELEATLERIRRMLHLPNVNLLSEQRLTAMSTEMLVPPITQ